MPVLPVVLTNVVVAGRRCNVRLVDGRIETIGQAFRSLPPDIVIDGGGRWLHVGLHDHHLHLRALDAAGRSVSTSPKETRGPAEFELLLRQKSTALPFGEWLRVVGYHESIAGPLDRHVVDKIVPDRPVRVQHRSGELWILNSAALRSINVDDVDFSGVDRDRDGRLTGRFWRSDHWLAGRWPSDPSGDLAALSRRAAAMGVTGWTDATPGRSDEEEDELLGMVESGAIVQRLHLMVRPGRPEAGRNNQGGHERCSMGPVKIILDDLNLPTMNELVGVISEAHRAARPVAIHCVTRVQAVLTVASLEVAGSSGMDRIEHGAMIPSDLFDRMRMLGVTVVTQPNFVAERGDAYLSEVEGRDQPDLWRAGSLMKFGIRVAIGTDAPFGHDDPWAAARASTTRRTIRGHPLGLDETVEPVTALRWLSGSGDAPWQPRRIESGAPADLILLDAPPEDALDRGPDAVAVTIAAGSIVYNRELLG